MKKYFVYIVGNSRPTLYIGVTENLVKRVYEHREGLAKSFTSKYFLKKLLYFEVFQDIKEAIKREKQLKHWNRAWKLKLVREKNPNLEDLYEEITR
jgi:putative endonuclease